MEFTVACASNSDTILNANLARSPLFAKGIPLHLERDAPSAGIAYNRALSNTAAPVVVFAHHDVYLPQGWEIVLAARLAEVEAKDPNWALFGAFGVGLDNSHIGPVWSSSIGQIVGRVPMEPTRVQSYDELLIVLRRGSGIRFDDAAPGWHMYGTDIVTTARAQGLNAYAGALPTIHNDRYHEALQSDFVECYSYMRRKWRAMLPLRTPIIKISASGLHLYRNRWKDMTSKDFRENMAVGTEYSPERLAELCGWSNLTTLTG